MSTTSAAVTMTNRAQASKTRRLVQIAVLGAIAAVLMLFEFPLPVAPPFYKLDFSEIPIMIGGFAMGPVAGVLIEAIKIVINTLLNGTSTMFVGELGNFIIGCAMVVPASLIYRKLHTRKGALVSMIIGTLVMSAIGVLVNAFILLPTYASAFHWPLEDIIAMGTAIHPSINSVMSFVLLTVLPFNLIKGAIICAITFVIYKYLRKIIK